LAFAATTSQAIVQTLKANGAAESFFIKLFIVFIGIQVFASLGFWYFLAENMRSIHESH
jgi:hypothetical protein